jgi:hypothetical protein
VVFENQLGCVWPERFLVDEQIAKNLDHAADPNLKFEAKKSPDPMPKHRVKPLHR